VKTYRLSLGILLVALLLVACQAVPTGAPQLSSAPIVAPTTAGGSVGTTTLTVLAAASLTDSFKEIGVAFGKANPGVQVTFSFAGSQALRTQIEQGAKADVFASADTKNMDPLKTENLLGNTPQIFTRNVLTVIIPKANPAGLKELKDLTKPGVKLIFEDASVPAGNYTLQILDKLSADPAHGSDFKTKVLANVVSKETDVKAVVSKVSLGEGDAGVVYTTDAQVAADKLSTIAIPAQYNVIATYPIAVLRSSVNSALALKFVDFVLGADGQAVLKRYGFVPLQ
jgi:molybdate transport system substrate-binding protein